MTVDWSAAAAAAALCVAVVILEVLVTGDEVRTWYPTLDLPRWRLPLPAYIAVGVVVYLIDAFVAYRMLTAVHPRAAQVVALTALSVVMVSNALANYALFHFRSPLIGFLSIVAFLGPVVTLQVALFAYDRVAALAHLPYAVFVVTYDLPLYYAVWRRNPRAR